MGESLLRVFAAAVVVGAAAAAAFLVDLAVSSSLFGRCGRGLFPGREAGGGLYLWRTTDLGEFAERKKDENCVLSVFVSAAAWLR